MSIKYMNDAWDMPLNTHEKMVLLAIADCSNDEGFAFPGYQKLLKKTGMGREALSKHLKVLKEIGILKVESHGEIGKGKKVNTYTISLRSELPINSDLELIEKIKELRAKYKKAISSHLEPRKVRTSNSKSSHLEHETPVLTTSSEPSLSCPKSKIEKDEIKNTSIHFHKFWEAYPTKAQKKDCLKKWKAKNLDGKAQLIIADVKSRKLDDVRWLSGYVPNPLTYINQERWQDEINTTQLSNNQINQNYQNRSSNAGLSRADWNSTDF